MSNRRSIADFPRNEAGLVDEFIGTAYDVVKEVYDNLDAINNVGDQIEQLDELAAAAVEEAMIPARIEIQAGVDAAEGFAQQAEVAADRANSINTQYPFTYTVGNNQYDVTAISGDPTVNTSGMTLWVEGALEYDFTINSTKLFTLNTPSAYADGAHMKIIINGHFDDVIQNLESLEGTFNAEFDAAQAAREDEFNEFMENSALEVPIPYVAGLVLTRPTQVVTFDHLDYRVISTYLPLTTSNWTADAPKMAQVPNNNLRDDLASDLGFTLVAGKIALANAVRRVLRDKATDFVSVLDYVLPGAQVTAGAVNAACLALYNAGGGTLNYPAGWHLMEDTIILRKGVHHVGAGNAATNVVLAPGVNKDLFKTQDFDTLTGVGNISDAPYGFSIRGMTLRGNYLDLGLNDDAISWVDAETVLNHTGSAIKIFGSRFIIDCEVYNVPDNAIYMEGIGNFFPNQEHGAFVHIEGRISGQEGMVFRGPGDIVLNHFTFGLCGLIPASERPTTTERFSKLYPTEQVHGMLLDNSNGYQGHCEMNLIHMYAVSFGYGIKTLGVNRFNARHICTDNSRGGMHFSDGAHGVIAICEARACGRNPAGYSGSGVPPLRDVLIDNGDIWNLNINIKSARYSPSRDDADPLVDVKGSNNIVTLSTVGQIQAGTGKPILGPALAVSGDNNNVRFMAKRVNGDVLRLSGTGNTINGSADGVYTGTVLTRDCTQVGKACYGNMVTLSAIGLTADSVGFNSIGTAATENLKLCISGATGYVPFTGSPMAAINRACVWEFAGSVGNGINGKTAEDYLEVALPALAISGTIVIPHNFIYAPNRTQITLGLNFPGTPPNQLVQLGVVSTSATDITVAYRWAALPTSGAANIQVHIR